LAKDNLYYWLRDYRGFLEFFFSQMFTEPHSTKPIEDCVGWGLGTTAGTLIATEIGNGLGKDDGRELCGRIRCPVLVIQGTADAITGPGRGMALAEATGGDLVLLEGSEGAGVAMPTFPGTADRAVGSGARLLRPRRTREAGPTGSATVSRGLTRGNQPSAEAR